MMNSSMILQVCYSLFSVSFVDEWFVYLYLGIIPKSHEASLTPHNPLHTILSDRASTSGRPAFLYQKTILLVPLLLLRVETLQLQLFAPQIKPSLARPAAISLQHTQPLIR